MMKLRTYHYESILGPFAYKFYLKCLEVDCAPNIYTAPKLKLTFVESSLPDPYGRKSLLELNTSDLRKLFN